MMIKCLLSVGLLCLMQPSSAQFMKVVDVDGFVNMRDKPGGKSKVVAKIDAGELLYHLEADEGAGNNWLSVIYEQRAGEVYGYIHSSRLKAISEFTGIPYVAGQNDYWTFKPADTDDLADVVKVEVTFERSNPLKLRAALTEDENGNWLLNGNYVWGLNDPKLPVWKYKSIEVDIQGQKIAVPAEVLESLFAVAFVVKEDEGMPMEVYYDKVGDALYIKSLNGDGAYAYDVLFVFEKGKFKKRIVHLPF